MRKTLVATMLVAIAFPAFAQQQPARQPANPDANTPAVNSPNSPPNPGAPVAGANSFTEGQARSRIEAKGFKDVSDLRHWWYGTRLSALDSQNAPSRGIA